MDGKLKKTCCFLVYMLIIVGVNEISIKNNIYEKIKINYCL